MGVFSKENLKSAGRIFGNVSGGAVMRRNLKETTYPPEWPLSTFMRVFFFFPFNNFAYAWEINSRRHTKEPDRGFRNGVLSTLTIGAGLLADSAEIGGEVAIGVATGGAFWLAVGALHVIKNLAAGIGAEIIDRRGNYIAENTDSNTGNYLDLSRRYSSLQNPSGY